MRNCLASAAIALLLPVLALPQSPTQAEEPGVPAASNVPGARTPSIDSQRRITFALKAPDAASVQVAGGDGLGPGPFPMTKGADGTWSVTTPPSVPGFHYYSLVLSGVAVNDPASETYFGYGKEISGVEVPEAGADFYAIRNVPHGEVRAKWYLSKTTGEWRRAFVYTPPGYAEHSRTAIPCSFFSTARARTRRVGRGKAGRNSYSIISLPGARRGR